MIQSVTSGKAEIAVYRSRKIDIVITDNLNATYDSRPEDYYNLICFDNIEDALAWNPDAVFVTNPISLHASTSLLAAKSGAHIFIEKPLNHNQEGIKHLSQVVDDNNLTCMVGYQLRYHPAYLYIKNLLRSESLGRIFFADFHFGEWLPGMHPYEDYRTSHASRSDQGGGVILCLSHMIDMAYWFFGLPQCVSSIGGHLSDLEIDVEDTVDIMMRCRHLDRDLPVHIHLDFLQKSKRIYTYLVGEKGSVLFDYCTNRLELNLFESDPCVIVYDEFNRNDMFFQEIADFIDSCDNKCKPPIPLEQGIDVLNICLAAKRSLETGNAELIV